MSATEREPDGFVGAYLRARVQEQRLLADEVVRTLPYPSRRHPHAGEWRERADTARRFTSYLASLGRPVVVWELGCGNGWFAARMAQLEHVSVVGIDINDAELDQARRVFGGRPRLHFCHSDLRRGVGVHDDVVVSRSSAGEHDRRLDQRPDIVLLASSLQYVADAHWLLADLLGAVPVGGEIHVVDTPFHHAGDLPAARERSRRHYAAIGVDEMARHYHHHGWAVFEALPHDVLYRPDALRHRLERRILRRHRSRFPWVRCAADTGLDR
jgi:SAM-dependent methyltransferase